MPIFILFSLSIGYLVHHSNPLISYVLEPTLCYAGAALSLISGTGVLLKKPATINWYDIFASSSLLLWFNLWHRLFNADSPMFHLFPFYLALVAGAVSVFFISQGHRIDAQTREYMQTIAKTSKLQSAIVMGLVIASLFMTEHYLTFPIAMTLLMLKFAFDECLKQSDGHTTAH